MQHRSPIEMMVDRACGFDPDAPQPTPSLDQETETLLAAADALVAWRASPTEANIAALEKAADALIALGWHDGPLCSPHPDAPHGFDRQASHNAGRYVCECEGWAAAHAAAQPSAPAK